jgi:hypothetical protein
LTPPCSQFDGGDNSAASDQRHLKLKSHRQLAWCHGFSQSEWQEEQRQHPSNCDWIMIVVETRPNATCTTLTDVERRKKGFQANADEETVGVGS